MRTRVIIAKKRHVKLWVKKLLLDDGNAVYSVLHGLMSFFINIVHKTAEKGHVVLSYPSPVSAQQGWICQRCFLTAVKLSCCEISAGLKHPLTSCLFA